MWKYIKRLFKRTNIIHWTIKQTDHHTVAYYQNEKIDHGALYKAISNCQHIHIISSVQYTINNTILINDKYEFKLIKLQYD